MMAVEGPYGVYTGEQADRVLADLGVEARLVYKALEYQPGRTPGEVAQDTGLSRDHVGEKLRRLEGEGLVRSQGRRDGGFRYHTNVEGAADDMDADGLRDRVKRFYERVIDEGVRRLPHVERPEEKLVIQALEHEPLTIQELVEETHEDYGTVETVLDRLQDRGVVEDDELHLGAGAVYRVREGDA